MSLNVLRQCRQGIEAKRRVLEGLQKKCTAAQAKLEGEYGQLGSLEAKTKELENLRKVKFCYRSLHVWVSVCGTIVSDAVHAPHQRQ